MKNGWYILNYHDVSWEENPFIRGIGGSFAPDIFTEHLEVLNQNARLVSIQEGFELFCNGDLKEPLVSFWFDDGFTGVRKYAMPIMETFGVKGAISINSRFTLREEMFWRSKLSYLSHVDGMRFVRSRLKPYGYTLEKSVKGFTMDHFSEEIINAIDSVYNEFANKITQKDAFRLFDTMEGIQVLHQNGWEITNHSSAHYPVSEDAHIQNFKIEFDECEQALNKHLGIQTRFWVIPFDRQTSRSGNLEETFYAADNKGRYLALVGDRFNDTHQSGRRILYRIEPPYLDGKRLVRHLKSLPSNV